MDDNFFELSRDIQNGLLDCLLVCPKWNSCEFKIRKASEHEQLFTPSSMVMAKIFNKSSCICKFEGTHCLITKQRYLKTFNAFNPIHKDGRLLNRTKCSIRSKLIEQSLKLDCYMDTFQDYCRTTAVSAATNKNKDIKKLINRQGLEFSTGFHSCSGKLDMVHQLLLCIRQISKSESSTFLQNLNVMSLKRMMCWSESFSSRENSNVQSLLCMIDTPSSLLRGRCTTILTNPTLNEVVTSCSIGFYDSLHRLLSLFLMLSSAESILKSFQPNSSSSNVTIPFIHSYTHWHNLKAEMIVRISDMGAKKSQEDLLLSEQKPKTKKFKTKKKKQKKLIPVTQSVVVRKPRAIVPATQPKSIMNDEEFCEHDDQEWLSVDRHRSHQKDNVMYLFPAFVASNVADTVKSELVSVSTQLPTENNSDCLTKQDQNDQGINVVLSDVEWWRFHCDDAASYDGDDDGDNYESDTDPAIQSDFDWLSMNRRPLLYHQEIKSSFNGTISPSKSLLSFNFDQSSDESIILELAKNKTISIEPASLAKLSDKFRSSKGRQRKSRHRWKRFLEKSRTSPRYLEGRRAKPESKQSADVSGQLYSQASDDQSNINEGHYASASDASKSDVSLARRHGSVTRPHTSSDKKKAARTDDEIGSWLDDPLSTMAEVELMSSALVKSGRDLTLVDTPAHITGNISLNMESNKSEMKAVDINEKNMAQKNIHARKDSRALHRLSWGRRHLHNSDIIDSHVLDDLNPELDDKLSELKSRIGGDRKRRGLLKSSGSSVFAPRHSGVLTDTDDSKNKSEKESRKIPLSTVTRKTSSSRQSSSSFSKRSQLTPFPRPSDHIQQKFSSVDRLEPSNDVDSLGLSTAVLPTYALLMINLETAAHNLCLLNYLSVQQSVILAFSLTRGQAMYQTVSPFALSSTYSFSDETSRSYASILFQDISLFVQEVDKLESRRHRFKCDAMLKCMNVVQSLWPRAQVKLFGSHATGSSLPSSDIDLVICLPNVLKNEPADAPGVLEGRNAIKETWQQNLARCLRNELWVDTDSIQIIANTIVPLIKLHTKVSLDISFETQMHSGLISKDYLIGMMGSFPELRMLHLVLKQLLFSRGLNEAFTGGLSSYGLAMLIIRFLQESGATKCKDSGHLLLGFLEFYGKFFDPRATGVCISRSCYVVRHIPVPFLSNVPPPSLSSSSASALSWMTHQAGLPLVSMSRSLSSSNRALCQLDGAFQSMGTSVDDSSNHQSAFDNATQSSIHDGIPSRFDPLFIEDPLNLSNNIGRNTFRISQVIKAFSDAYDKLIERTRESRNFHFGGSDKLNLLSAIVEVPI